MAYISQKQLGGVLNITDVDTTGDVVGTGADIAQARAINFNQTTPDVLVSLAEPNPPVAKLYHVVNRGSVPVTIDIDGDVELVVNPGPVYGVYWNGENYTYMQVEGVGTVSHVVETPSAELEGSGSPLSPLGVNVKVSTLPGNALSVEDDGLFLQKVTASTSSLRAVDATNGNDIYAGDLFAPFKTIAKALENAVAGMLIAVLPGTYTEDIVIPAGVTIEGFVGKETKINGQVTHAAGSLSAILRNIILAGKVGVPTIELNGATTGLKLDNVGLYSADGMSGIAVRFVGNNSGEFDFKNVDIRGNITIADNVNAVNLTIEGGQSNFGLTMGDALASVKIVNRFSTGTLTHNSGKLIASGIGYIQADENSESLISSATALSESLLVLENVGFLQPDGSFGELVKTGDCSYAFGSVHLQSDNDTFVGTRIFVDNAGNIHAGYVPTAYTPTSDSLVGHLAGINAKLADSGGGLGTVSTSDSDTIDFSGTGAEIDPISAAVKISSAANNALIANEDGLHVPVVDSGLESIAVQSGDTIDLTGSGTSGDPLMAEVSISTDPTNKLIKDANGLLVPAEQQYLDIIFTFKDHWLDSENLISLIATRDFILPQGLVGSYSMLRAIAGENVNTIVTLTKVLAGVEEVIGSITFAYDSAVDVGTPGDPGADPPIPPTFPTYMATVTYDFQNDVSFSVGSMLVLTTDVTARFDNVSIDLLAKRPL